MCGCKYCDVHYAYVYAIKESKMKFVLVGCGNQFSVCRESTKEEVRND